MFAILGYFVQNGVDDKLHVFDYHYLCSFELCFFIDSDVVIEVDTVRL